MDIDINNCHPEILYQLCIAEGIDCPDLKKYIENRQAFFDEGVNSYGCEKDDIKVLFIIYLYGGKFENRSRCLSAHKCKEGVVEAYSGMVDDCFRHRAVTPFLINSTPLGDSYYDGRRRLWRWNLATFLTARVR